MIEGLYPSGFFDLLKTREKINMYRDLQNLQYLSPLEYFLCGAMLTIVYKQPVTSEMNFVPRIPIAAQTESKKTNSFQKCSTIPVTSVPVFGLVCSSTVYYFATRELLRPGPIA